MRRQLALQRIDIGRTTALTRTTAQHRTTASNRQKCRLWHENRLATNPVVPGKPGTHGAGAGAVDADNPHLVFPDSDRGPIFTSGGAGGNRHRKFLRKQPGQPHPRRTGETRYPWSGAEVGTFEIYHSQPAGNIYMSGGGGRNRHGELVRKSPDVTTTCRGVGMWAPVGAGSGDGRNLTARASPKPTFIPWGAILA